MPDVEGKESSASHQISKINVTRAALEEFQNDMFVAFDGDGIGRRLELYLLQNREIDIRSFSNAVTDAIREIGRMLEVNGGELIMCSGDSVLAKFLTDKPLNQLVTECENFFFERTGSSISSGWADDLRGVLIAIKMAKGKKHVQTNTLLSIAK